MKSAIILCTVIVMCLNSFIFALPCKVHKNPVTFKQLLNFPASFQSLPPDIIEIIQDCQSVLDCSRDCKYHVGDKLCYAFQFHKSTGVCELLGSSEVSDKVRDTEGGWSAYELQKKSVDCDLPWVMEKVNGAIEFVLTEGMSTNTSSYGCLPVEIRVGTSVSFIGLHRRVGYKNAQLRSNESGRSAILCTLDTYTIVVRNFIDPDVTFPTTYSWGMVNDVEFKYETCERMKVTIDDKSVNWTNRVTDLDKIDIFHKNGILNEIRIRP